MPLFFFISGFFVYSFNYSFSLLKTRTYNRLVRQLYPTLLLMTLFVFTRDESFFNGFELTLYDEYKSGYWFTIVVVEMFLITAPLLTIFHVCRLNLFTRNILLLIPILAAYMLFRSTNNMISLRHLFCGSHLFIYIPYFIMGIFVKMNQEMLMSVILNKYFIGICCIGFVVVQDIPTPARMLCVAAGILALFGLAYNLFKFECVRDSKVSKALRFIGTSTLEIYLLHYFVIHFLKTCVPFLQQLGAFKGSIYEFPLFFGLSMLIVAACLLAVYILKKLKIYNYIFPGSSKSVPVKSLVLSGNT